MSPRIPKTRPKTVERLRAWMLWPSCWPIIGNSPRAELSTRVRSAGSSAKDDAQDGHQEEEQREDGDEHGIGELNAKSASVVVTVFLYDREDEKRATK